MTDIHPLSDLKWPKQGLQPAAVVETLDRELTTNVLPIYLPDELPPGFFAGPDFVFEKAGGGHLPNPQVWNQTQGERAGYGVTFTDGNDTVTVWVNPAADTGEADWLLSDVPFEGGFFSSPKGSPTFLEAKGAKGSVIVVNGTKFDAILEVARHLARVE